MSTPSPLANAIRALSMDAVEKAQSGHCGLPLGFADVRDPAVRGVHSKFDAQLRRTGPIATA